MKKLRGIILLLIVLAGVQQYSFSQNVGIGTATPDKSARLDITSSKGGLLPPRMTDVERDAIANPAKGLIVFTTKDSSFYFYDGAWRRLAPADEVWSLHGNAATPGRFIGTTNNERLLFKVNNVERMGLDSFGRLELLSPADNFIIGRDAGTHLTTGMVNNFSGLYAGQNNTSGKYNYFSGYAAGMSNTIGGGNNFTGQWAGFYNDRGNGNHFVGYAAGYYNINGHGNHFDGHMAGFRNIGDTISTTDYGSFNYFSGVQAGIANKSGRYLTLVGNFTNVTKDSLSNAGAIGYKARVSQDNSFVIGGTGPNRVNVGIGTTTPQTTLDVSSNQSFSDIAVFRSTGGWGQILVTEGTTTSDLGAYPGNGYTGTNSPGDFHIRTGATTRMFFQHSSGNIGIGTATPTEKLDVNGNIKLSGLIQNEAFQAPALQGSWKDYVAPHATSAFYKDKEGRVYLRGLVYNGLTAAGSVIFTLPPGYRPSASGQLVFLVLNNDGLGRIDIHPNGNIEVAIGSAGWFSLDGISFRAD